MTNSISKSLSRQNKADWRNVYIILHRSHKYVKFGKSHNPLSRFEDIGIEIFDLTRCIVLKASTYKEGTKLENSLRKTFDEFNLQSSQLRTSDFGKNGKTEWYSSDVLPLLEPELQKLAQSIPHERINFDLHSKLTQNGDPAISSTMCYADEIYRRRPKAKTDDIDKANRTQTILTEILTLAWRYSKLDTLDNCFLLEIETTKNLHAIEELARLIADLKKIGELSLTKKSFIRSAMCSENSAFIKFNASLEKMPRNSISSTPYLFIEDTHELPLSTLRELAPKFHKMARST